MPVEFNAEATGIISYLFALTFDPAVVEVTGITGVSPFLDLVTNSADFTSGLVRFGANASTLDTPPSGFITLAQVTFRVVGNSGDTSALTLDFAAVPGGISAVVDEGFQPRAGVTFLNGLVKVQ